MRILVVDDSDSKRSRVVSVLREEFGSSSPLHLAEAVDYEEATENLRDGFFDLVVLDLKLPAAGGDASEHTSKELMRRLLLGDRLIPPTHIIGLTEFPGLCDTEGSYYDENLFALIVYDPVDDTWRRQLCSKIRYLIASKGAAARFAMNNYDVDLVVLAARHANEYLPIRKRLFSQILEVTHPAWGGEITFGDVSGPNGRTLRGALICVGEMGMAVTASVATQAIHVFRPRLLAMAGMCCGFAGGRSASPRRLGDVIIAREVACWEEGKYVPPAALEDPEFRNRAKTRLVNDVIREEVDRAVEAGAEVLTPRLSKLARSSDYKKLVAEFGPEETRPIPEVRFAPMVSGSSVVADEAMIGSILDRHPAAIGLDMELYGLYAAVDRSNGARPAVLGVKGVADFGRSDKGDKAQKVASVAAAEVLLGIVQRLSVFAPS